ncbi:MAG: hypothetical protein IPK31_19445 [Chitinophagaceae bacterium]|nr:hypothetical protein [Chitinophagaceae bacterium]
MKYKLAILFSFFAIACATQKKVEYDLPIGMSPSVIPNFLERYNKGKALYKIICADCHNKKTNGKTVVPDFTPAQLDTYKRNFRQTNKEHTEKLTEKSMSENELDFIIYYLTYKKKNLPAK